MNKHSGINITVSIPIILLLIFLLYENAIQDNNNKYYLQHTYDDYPLDINDRIKIEYVIHNYLNTREKLKSNSDKVLSEMYIGVIRGAITAMILGGGMKEITIGSLVSGIVSGIIKAYKNQYYVERNIT